MILTLDRVYTYYRETESFWYTCRMTLTTHAVVGAAVVSMLPQHPVLGVCLAFASHFAIDAIPHWDYPIASASINPLMGSSMKYDKSLILDATRIGADALTGVSLAVLFFASPQTLTPIVLGACAGILPDPLQFVYTRFRREPLVSLQLFHQWIHTKNYMKNAVFLGVSTQLIFIATIVIAVKVLR